MAERTIAIIEAELRESERAVFRVDVEVYERSCRDPRRLINFAGSLDGAPCIVGRDPGEDEVPASKRLSGAAGLLAGAEM